MEPKENRPDILIVVFDCVSADAFPGGRTPDGGLPFLDSLRENSICYTNAHTVAPWTVPAHASLLTGLFPFEHGLYRGGPSQTISHCVKLPEVMSKAGYATALFSANPFLGPQFGLSDGFEVATRGSWTAHLFRERPDGRRTVPGRSQPAEFTDSLKRLQKRHQLLRAVDDVSSQIPRVNSILTELVDRVDPGFFERRGESHPWIESLLKAWLDTLSANRPAFCVVNLIDAHEPYLGAACERRTSGFPPVRMQQGGALSGHSRLTSEQLASLREAYRAQLRVLDKRACQIMGTFSRSGRTDNLLTVLTSDHGQEFGEENRLFHGSGLSDRLIHVPLWVNSSRLALGGKEIAIPSSTVDILPTILAATNVQSPLHTSGVNLLELVHGGRRPPIFAVSSSMDERAGSLRSESGARSVGTYDLLAVVDGLELRMRVNEAGNVLSENITPMRLGSDAATAGTRTTGEAVLRGAVRKALSQLHPPRGTPTNEGVLSRLAGWGY